MSTRRPYLWLLGAVLALALAVSALGRVPGRRAMIREKLATPTTAVAVALTIEDGALNPATIHALKGQRLALTVVNAGSSRAELALPGYEDRLPAVALQPGASWRGELLADRPGEDFAFLVNGEPAGRLIVAGSHLVEGHQ